MLNDLFPPLSNIRHPLEGIFYLILIAVFTRFVWPTHWNEFLSSIAAKKENDLSDIDK